MGYALVALGLFLFALGLFLAQRAGYPTPLSTCLMVLGAVVTVVGFIIVALANSDRSEPYRPDLKASGGGYNPLDYRMR